MSRNILLCDSNEGISRESIKGQGSAAILVSPDGQILMQLRDKRDDIWFPDHWGLFGGAIDPGENALTALHREISEELGIDIHDPCYLSQIAFDLGAAEFGFRRRYFYVADVSSSDINAMVITEGQESRFFDLEELLCSPISKSVVPYDLVGLIHYHHREALYRAGHLR